MDEGGPALRRLRSFLIGGVLGASAVIATVRRRRRGRRDEPRISAGLVAFEDAPCFHETVERERTASKEA